MNSNSNSKAVLDEAVQKAERVLAELLEDGIGRLSKAGGPEPDGDEPPPEASGSAAPGPGGAPPGEAAGEGGDAGGEDPMGGEGDGGGDPVAHYVEMFSQQDPSEVEAIYEAARQVLMGAGGGGAGGPGAGPDGGSPGAGGPPPAAPGPSPEAAALKSEVAQLKNALAKSEKQISDLASMVQRITPAAGRRAVTGDNAAANGLRPSLRKSEKLPDMSREEVQARLSAKVRQMGKSGELTKSEGQAAADLIMKYNNQEVGLDKIAYLLR